MTVWCVFVLDYCSAKYVRYTHLSLSYGWSAGSEVSESLFMSVDVWYCSISPSSCVTVERYMIACIVCGLQAPAVL